MTRLLLALMLLAAPGFAQSPKPGQAPQRQAPPQEREILLRNGSQSVLREIYLWASTETEQGRDRLGADVVRPGGSLRIPLGRVGCQMLMRAVFEDGGVETRSLDVCQSRDLVLDDRNTRPVEVVNNTDMELMQLFLSRPGAQGPDRLGAATVPGNDTFRVVLRGETECEFEARAVFRGSRADSRQNVNICTTPRIAFGDPAVPLREVTIANRSSRILRELYAAAGPGAWGADRLGSTVLNPGQSFLLRIRNEACRVRMRAIFADNRAEERLEVDICAGQEVVFTPAQQVTLIHAHARPVREVYLSAVQDANWGENLLGPQPLASGQQRRVGTDSGCQADLRVVFDNGNAEEARNLNVCERREITLRPGWVAE